MWSPRRLSTIATQFDQCRFPWWIHGTFSNIYRSMKTIKIKHSWIGTYTSSSHGSVMGFDVNIEFWWDLVFRSPTTFERVTWTHHPKSGQVKNCQEHGHQAKWNDISRTWISLKFKNMSLTKPQLGVRSCEVAMIWPDLMSTSNWLRICCRKKNKLKFWLIFGDILKNIYPIASCITWHLDITMPRTVSRFAHFFLSGGANQLTMNTPDETPFIGAIATIAPGAIDMDVFFLTACIVWNGTFKTPCHKMQKKKRWQCRSKSDPNSSTFDEAQGGDILWSIEIISVYQYTCPSTWEPVRAKFLMIMAFYP